MENISRLGNGKDRSRVEGSATAKITNIEFNNELAKVTARMVLDIGC